MPSAFKFPSGFGREVKMADLSILVHNLNKVRNGLLFSSRKVIRLL